MKKRKLKTSSYLNFFSSSEISTIGFSEFSGNVKMLAANEDLSAKT